MKQVSNDFDNFLNCVDETDKLIANQEFLSNVQIRQNIDREVLDISEHLALLEKIDFQNITVEIYEKAETYISIILLSSENMSKRLSQVLQTIQDEINQLQSNEVLRYEDVIIDNLLDIELKSHNIELYFKLFLSSFTSYLTSKKIYLEGKIGIKELKNNDEKHL